MQTEEERVGESKKDDIWSDEDDLKIFNLQFEIENLIKTQKQLFIPSQKQAVGVDISNKENDLFSLRSKRKEIIGKTAEEYASVRSDEEMLRYFLFKDKDLTKNLFTEGEFSELDDLELMFFMKSQAEISNRLCELNIQKAVLRPFFSMYMSQCENINAFYGKAIILLSVYQLKVVLFARMFYNIFQYVEDIPDDIKDNPEKLLAFSDMQTNKSSGRNMIDDNADASSIFGATKEDMKALAGKDSNTISLSDELAKNGGALDMEQMMKLAGY